MLLEVARKMHSQLDSKRLVGETAVVSELQITTALLVKSTRNICGQAICPYTHSSKWHLM